MKKILIKLDKFIDEYIGDIPTLILWLCLLLSLLKFEKEYAILVAILILNQNVERLKSGKYEL